MLRNLGVVRDHFVGLVRCDLARGTQLMLWRVVHFCLHAHRLVRKNGACKKMQFGAVNLRCPPIPHIRPS